MRNKYILMRHGETKYQANKSNILYPQKEQFSLPITKRAEKGIKQTAKKFKSVDLIFASDYYRTKQTANIVAKKLGKKVFFDKRLRDTNFGIFSGKPDPEHREYFSSKMQRFSKRPPGGDSWRDIKKRAVDFIKEIDKKYKDKTILIVSHADPLWLLAGYIKGLKEKQLLEKRNPKQLWLEVGQIIKP
ncbi:hypothetical protein AMJ47_00870 [Parcubacteria bacterium DG_72]|nr:MAG: hypothetical protein AMJ47_00870 [Parcubacteria bacterium DG_72]